MSIMITVEFPLHDGKQSDLLAFLAEALSDTRAFDGCISVETDLSPNFHPFFRRVSDINFAQAASFC